MGLTDIPGGAAAARAAHNAPSAGPAIICDMTDAVDTPAERLTTYRRLLGEHLQARVRTPEGIRFRLRPAPGLLDEVRELAAREMACCPFFAIDVTQVKGEIHWDTAVPDNDLAREVLAEFYELGALATCSADAIADRLASSRFPLPLVRDSTGTVRTATREELTVGD